VHELKEKTLKNKSYRYQQVIHRKYICLCCRYLVSFC